MALGIDLLRLKERFPLVRLARLYLPFHPIQKVIRQDQKCTLKVHLCCARKK